VRAPEPNQLKTFFSGFDIDFYAESEGPGDWGGPKSSVVRMLARKGS
jgi:hypothetical protein